MGRSVYLNHDNTGDSGLKPVTESQTRLKIVHGAECGASVKQDRIAEIDANGGALRRIVFQYAAQIRCKVRAMEMPQSGACFAEGAEAIEPFAALYAGQNTRLSGVSCDFGVQRMTLLEVQKDAAVDANRRLIDFVKVGTGDAAANFRDAE